MFFRAYIYNKEKKGFETRKVFRSVKSERKIQLSSRKIWWNGKLLVLLHSLLRNTLSLSNIKKEFFERFYINRQVVQEAVDFLEIRKLTG